MRNVGKILRSLTFFSKRNHDSLFLQREMSAYSLNVSEDAGSMRAAVLSNPSSKLSTEILKIPRPNHGEVLLKVKACGVCHTDLHILKSEIPFPTPCVLGHEVTGEVVAHGPSADLKMLSRFPVGSKVVGAFIMPCGGCEFCTQGKEDICSQFFEMNRGKGTLYDGKTRLFKRDSESAIAMYSMAAMAEYCVVPSTALSLLHPSLPFAESAIVGCAMFTGYGAMRNAADLRAGQSVAVVGVGGVGSSCIQISKAFGSSCIIAVDVSEDKLMAAKQFGATHTVNALKENVVETIRELSGGHGVDVAVEALGRPSTFSQTLLSVKDGGKAVMVGIAPLGVTAEIDITRLVRRNISVIGSYGAKARKDLPTIVDMAAKGLLDVTSVVTERHGLDAADEVYRKLDRGEIIGRAIIDMDL